MKPTCIHSVGELLLGLQLLLRLLYLRQRVEDQLSQIRGHTTPHIIARVVERLEAQLDVVIQLRTQSHHVHALAGREAIGRVQERRVLDHFAQAFYAGASDRLYPVNNKLLQLLVNVLVNGLTGSAKAQQDLLEGLNDFDADLFFVIVYLFIYLI